MKTAVGTRSVLLLLAGAISATVLAAVWIRTPAVWPSMPDVFWHSLDSLLGAPASQEQVADREFLVLWIFALVGVSSLLLGAIGFRRAARR